MTPAKTETPVAPLYGGVFDFSDMAKDKPRNGYRVLQADRECLRIVRGDKTHVVTGDGRGQFTLRSMTRLIDREPCFVLRTDDLGRLLRLLGYRRG